MDHIGKYFYYLPPAPWLQIIFRTLGRIAAPLFLFVFVQSLHHSKNRLKMTFRLYMAAVLMQIGNRVFGSEMVDGVSIQGFGVDGNIFMTFFFLSIAVSGVEALRRLMLERRSSDFGIFTFCSGIIVVSTIFGTSCCNNFRSLFFIKPAYSEYAFFIPLGCVMYFAGRKYQCLVFGFLSFAHFIKLLLSFDITRWTIMDYFFFHHVQWFILFALPFMLLYNGREGRKHKAFFYLYYPIHQYVLNALGLFFILRLR